jgi:hypothetical protein
MDVRGALVKPMACFGSNRTEISCSRKREAASWPAGLEPATDQQLRYLPKHMTSRNYFDAYTGMTPFVYFE